MCLQRHGMVRKIYKWMLKAPPIDSQDGLSMVWWVSLCWVWSFWGSRLAPARNTAEFEAAILQFECSRVQVATNNFQQHLCEKEFQNMFSLQVHKISDVSAECIGPLNVPACWKLECFRNASAIIFYSQGHTGHMENSPVLDVLLVWWLPRAKTSIRISCLCFWNRASGHQAVRFCWLTCKNNPDPNAICFHNHQIRISTPLLKMTAGSKCSGRCGLRVATKRNLALEVASCWLPGGQTPG